MEKQSYFQKSGFLEGRNGERLFPLLRANLDAVCRKRRFGISAEIKDKLSTISRATVERLLTVERKKHKLKGKSATKKGGLLKSQIPVRVFWRWDEKQPGFCEIDTVSHDGGEKSTRITRGHSR